MLRIALLGVGGRMGRTLLELAIDTPDLTVAGALTISGDPMAGADVSKLTGGAATGTKITDQIRDAMAGADVAIDFTLAAAAEGNARAAAAAGCPLVVGTTGLDKKAHAALDKASTSVPVVYAPNMSIGMNVLCRLAEVAAAALGNAYGAAINEIHHQHKIDRPSGSALRIAEAVARARGTDPAEVILDEDSAAKGDAGRIVISSVREGEVIGTHRLCFAGDGERLTISHEVDDRKIFAAGALAAARWIIAQPPGRYSMTDVLGL